MAIADQSRWRFVITNLSGVSLGGGGPVVNASNKQWGYHLNGARTAQITIGIDHPKANFILNNDTLLKVYRKTKVSQTWQLLMVGDVIQAEEDSSGDTGQLIVSAADPFWRLQRRFIGLAIDSIGRGTGYTDGSAVSLKDFTTLAANVLADVNSAFNSGITLGTITNTGNTSYIGPVYAQNVGDILQQLANTLGGPVWVLQPLEPSGSMPSTVISQMNIGPASSMNVNRPNAIFEYGTGKRNVSSYSRILSKDGLANTLYSTPQGFPSVTAQGDTMVIEQDSASQAAIGLYQDIVPTDLTSIPLRQQLCNEYLAVRKAARQQITFTPTVDCPLDYGVDYQVGDTVVARAYVSGQYRYNGTARIYGVDFTIDDNDAETPVLTLIPGG